VLGHVYKRQDLARFLRKQSLAAQLMASRGSSATTAA